MSNENSSSDVVLGGFEASREAVDDSNVVQFDLNEDRLKIDNGFLFSVVDEPFPNEVPSAILERWFPVLTGVLGPTPEINIHSAFETLLNIDTVMSALKSFEFFRAGVDVRIVISTTVFNYGALFVCPSSVMPVTVAGTCGAEWYNDSYTSSFEKWGRLLSNDPLIVDLSEQSEVTLSLKWPYPFQYISLRKYYNADASTNTSVRRAGRFALVLPNGVGRLDTTNSPTIQYSMWYKFSDPVAQCTTVDSTFVPPEDEDIQAQMKGFIPAATTSMGVLGAAATMSFLPRRGWDFYDDAVKEIKGSMRTAGIEGNKTEEVELDEDSHNNGVSNIPDMWGDVSGASAPFRSVLTCPEGRTKWHRIIDYISQPSLFTLGDIGVGDDFDFAAWPFTYGISYDRMSWMSQFYRFWRGAYTFVLIFLCSPLISMKLCISLNWSGLAVTPTAPNVQKRIVTVRGTTVVPITIPFISPTQWNLTVPYGSPIYNTDDVQVIQFRPTIDIAVLQDPISVGDIPARAHIYIYKKAEPDFQFYSLKQSYKVFNAPPEDNEIQAQMLASEICSKALSLQGGVESSGLRREAAVYIEEIGRRYAFVDLQDNQFIRPFETSVTATFGWQERANIQCLSAMFLYYRGSLDWKLGIDFDSANTTDTVTITASDGVSDVNGFVDPMNITEQMGNGQVRIDPRYTSVIDFKAPIIGVLDWWPTLRRLVDPQGFGDVSWMIGLWSESQEGVVEYTATVNDDQSLATTKSFVRLGMDAEFAYMVPPPHFNYWPTPVVASPSEGRKKMKTDKRVHRGEILDFRRKTESLTDKDKVQLVKRIVSSLPKGGA